MNAQPVEEKTLEEESKPFDVEEIRAKIPKAFRGYLDPIIGWANSVEARLNEIQKTLPKEIQRGFEKAVESQRQKQAEMLKKVAPQLSGQSQAGGFNIGSLLPLIQMFAGQGGQDEELQNITKELMRANLDRVKRDSDFTDAIKNAIVTKIAGKAVESLI